MSQRTTSFRPGRPGGKAERRLKRELVNKQLQQSSLAAITDTLREFVRTANSNPVIGLGLGIITVDVLYRSRIISITAAAAFYALFSAQVAGSIISDIAQLIPSFGDKSAKDAQQPTATQLTYAFGAPTATIAGGATERSQ